MNDQNITTAVEIDCLKPHVGSETILESVPEHLGGDVGRFPLYNVIAGPLEVIPMRGRKWNVPGYESLKKTFQKCCSIDRKKIYDEFFEV